MKKLFYLICVALIFSFLITGCNSYNKRPKDVLIDSEKIESYLKGKGYKVITYNGKINEYVLKKEDLLKLPHQQYWLVQKNDPSMYVGKTIETYSFIIKNHPLDNFIDNETKRTVVWVMLCEGKIIGGYSLPEMNLDGGVYSLEGKTAEEVQGLSSQELFKKWNEKYK